MRKALVLLHRYAGLALGCFLLLSGLTGSAIVFGDAIDAWLNPGLLTVTPRDARADLDAVLSKVEDAVPGKMPNVVSMPPTAEDAIEVVFQPEDLRVFVDPYSGEVLGQRHGNASLSGFLVDLHVHLLSGKTGEEVLGWAGLGGIVLSVIGLVLWWPRRGRWRQALSIKWSAGAFRVWFDVHRVVGVFALALILMTATTGAALALYDKLTEPALVLFTGKGARQPAPKSTPGGMQSAPLDPMLARAAALFPDGRITRITLPAKPDAAVAVRVRQQGEAHQFGRTFVWFDRYDGSLLRVDNALTAHRAVRIQSWLYPLHTGVYGGILTRWLQVAAGLSLSLLTVSGAWLWIKRSRSRAVAFARRETANQVLH
jgi:uncharacterized iron-regulated membrane protein